ncbi:uncharacterized protein LOC118277149 [Spodoptera frugiperda]|uniref:Uncharacterized protein LOC118277149 n=1 Tax=Spodoptera frugiperda TaxID=7108 RepID=A0A9R0DFR4_SPOFR|nr:uncharacterized protein LOC118277149 [Spodoptera frugiperda]
MKTLTIITVLSALVACYEASGELPGGYSLVYDDTADGLELSNTEINARNQNYKIVYEVVAGAPTAIGRVKNSVVSYRGPNNVKINRLVITNHITPASVVHTALDQSNMEVRFTSNLSQGISSTVQMYQRSGAGRAFGEPAFHLLIVVLMYFGYSQLA